MHIICVCSIRVLGMIPKIRLEVTPWPGSFLNNHELREIIVEKKKKKNKRTEMSHQARSRFCEPSLCATKYLETRNLSNENSTRQFEAIASLISRHLCLCKASMLHSKSYSLSSHYLSTFAKQHSLVHYLVANWKLHNKGQRFRNKHIQEKGLCA